MRRLQLTVTPTGAILIVVFLVILGLIVGLGIEVVRELADPAR